MKRIKNAVLKALSGGSRAGKGEPSAKRLVWRISENTPEGAWVDPGTTPAAPPEAAAREVVYDDWATSSMDLMGGTTVIEHADADSPGSAFDEVFERDPRKPEQDPT